jgi:hypothetical protein
MINLPTIPTWATTLVLESTVHIPPLQLKAYNFDKSYSKPLAVEQFLLEVLQQAGMTETEIATPTRFETKESIESYLLSRPSHAVLLSWESSYVNDFNFGTLEIEEGTIWYRYQDKAKVLPEAVWDNMFTDRVTHHITAKPNTNRTNKGNK